MTNKLPNQDFFKGGGAKSLLLECLCIRKIDLVLGGEGVGWGGPLIFFGLQLSRKVDIGVRWKQILVIIFLILTNLK